MGWECSESASYIARFRDAKFGWEFLCNLERPELGFLVVVGDTERMTLPSPISIIPPSSHRQSFDLAFPDHKRLFPPLTECYFRGQDAIALFPQFEEQEFGISVTYRVIQSNEQWLAIETVLALETDLLDSHPTADLIIRGPIKSYDQLDANPSASVVSGIVSASPKRKSKRPGAAFITLCDKPNAIDEANQLTTAVLLPPSDQAAAGLIAQDDRHLQIRLLAEFLEKGVIRKTRFWVTFWRHQPTYAEILECYLQLQQEPLPLTP